MILDPDIKAGFTKAGEDISSLNGRINQISNEVGENKKAISYRGSEIISLPHAAERFSDGERHTRLWRVVTAFRANDFSMFLLRFYGFCYAIPGIFDMSLSGYCFKNRLTIQHVAISRGSSHCDFVWLGYDSGNRLNCFLGGGLNKAYSSIRLDVQYCYGIGRSALPLAQKTDRNNWAILDSPTGTPEDATSWNGIENIVKVPVKKVLSQ